MSDFLKRHAAERQAEWVANVRPEIRTLAERGNVTWGEYQALRMNSYERETLHPALTDDALANLTEQYLSHCQVERTNHPAATYDQAVITKLTPLLIERLRARQNRNER